MAAEWSEQFNQQRMEKCLGVFQKLVNHWARANRFECRLVTDESPEGKTLDQIAKMYFSVGIGNDLTDLPFLDMLIVFKMLADHYGNARAHGGRRPRKEWTERYQVKTSFTEDEAFAILRDIETKVGIEIRQRAKRAGGIEVLEAFPDLKTLGRDKLQALCNDWLTTPTAKEFAVSELGIMEEGGKLTLNFRVDLTHKVEDREGYHFPMDDLLLYMVKHGIPLEPDRERLRARITSARQRGGPDVYQRFQVNLGPELPLFLTCKNPECRRLLMTQFKGRKCEKALWRPERIECPRCHQVHEYNQDDLHFSEE